MPFRMELVAGNSRDILVAIAVDDRDGLDDQARFPAHLSLGGVPPTGGFFGKFYIFKAALDADLVTLVVPQRLWPAIREMDTRDVLRAARGPRRTAREVMVGVRSAVVLPMDAVPDVTNVQVQVITAAPALSPESGGSRTILLRSAP